MATNQIAAVAFDSSPYLLATLPSPIRNAGPARPFKFSALRQLTEANTSPADAAAAVDGSVADSAQDPALSPLDSIDAVLGPPANPRDLSLPSAPGGSGSIPLDASSGPGSTSASSGQESPSATRPPPVSLDDLLPYFYAPSPPVSRATYQQK